MDLLQFEDKIVFNEILPSFDFLQSFIHSYIPQYKDFSNELKITILDLYYRLILLNEKIEIEEFKLKLKDLFGSEEIAIKIIDSYRHNSNPKLQNIKHFQIHDELIQISAVLRTINSQAFSGLNCLNSGFTRTGSNSIFGTGLAYASVFCLYEYMRSLFGLNINLSQLKEEYLKFGAPKLKENPAEYETWRRKMKRFNIGLDNIQKDRNKYGQFYHLIYFSNRLGYRETKRSISVAQQSMYLGSLPTWSLNTFTHEFIHAHVRGLLSIIYPIVILDNSMIDEEIYKIYRNRSIKIDGCNNLLEFLKVNILDIVHNLYMYDKYKNNGKVKNSTYIEIEDLVIALKRYHHEIDEIMVHVLDFHYFYSSSPSIYIKSIWSSWLTLPVTVSRIPEYLTRTITAVSTREDASRMEKFEIAIQTTITELENLKEYSFIDEVQLNIVLEKIKETEFQAELKKQFFEVWSPLSDLTLQFLYSNDLRDLLNTDFLNEFKKDGNYEYAIKEGEFIELRIDSPIKFLNYLLFFAFDNSDKVYDDLDNIECNTTWMLSVINSKLFNKTD